MWRSRLRIWYWYFSGSDSYCGAGSVLGPGISTCYCRHGQKKKKKVEIVAESFMEEESGNTIKRSPVMAAL